MRPHHELVPRTGNTWPTTARFGLRTEWRYDARTYTYDGNGFLRTKTLPGGQAYNMNYDGAGNVTQVILPTGTQTDYAYDAAGNVTSLQT